MTLSGPILLPLHGDATHLVVLVHSYGSDGDDLIGLAPHWQKQMPGAAFIAPTRDRLAAIADALAVEHVSLQASDPDALAAHIHAAGAIFLGLATPEAAGDYLAGPSHVHPTGGSVRRASGLRCPASRARDRAPSARWRMVSSPRRVPARGGCGARAG